MGSCQATPGFCEACGISSISLPREITGLPDPQDATHAVGMPATPCSTLKPSFSRMPERYFEVSNSCIPSSPKLKTLSTITCACFFIPSICPVRSALIDASLSGATLFCPKAFCERATWTAQEVSSTANADFNIENSVQPFSDILQVGRHEIPGRPLVDRVPLRLPAALQTVSGHRTFHLSSASRLSG